MNKSPVVSIVILTKNAGSKFRETLDMTFKQKTDYPFEVIVVDSGSKDETFEICKEFPIKLFEIKPEDFNHGTTRNFGISKTIGKYIILLVQDAIPYDENWMKALIQPFIEDFMVAGVYSIQIPHKDVNIFVQKGFRSNFLSQCSSRKIQKRDYIPRNINLTSRELLLFYKFQNVSSAISRDMWKKFPFNAISYSEDLDWSKRVIDSGYKIVHEPGSMVYHSHTRSIKEAFKKGYACERAICSLLNGCDAPVSIAKFIINLIKDTVCIFVNFLKFFLNKKEVNVLKLFKDMIYIVFYSISFSTGSFLATLSPTLLKRYKWYRNIEIKIMA